MSKNTPAKVNMDVAEVEQDDVIDDTDTDATTKPELVHFDVKLRNGKTVQLAALKNEDDWDIELADHAQRGNNAVVMFGVLTMESNWRLKQAGAKIPDFETISIEYGKAVGAIEE